MVNRSWAAGHVVAGLFWLGALGLTAMDALVWPYRYGPLGVVLAAAAGTLNIRCWLAHESQRTKEWLELGRQVERQRPRSV